MGEMRNFQTASKWWCRYSMAAAVLIGCMISYEAGADRPMRGKEYGDIRFKRLVSVYRDEYKKAGFDVTTRVKKGNNPIVTLHMRFSPPGTSKKQQALIDVEIDPSGPPSHTCTPCSVWVNLIQAESDDLENQMLRAHGKASRQLDKILLDHIWYDPAVWGASIYDHIGIDEVISSYKQAYAKLGFKLESQTEQKPKGDEERLILLFFVIADPGQSSNWGRAGLYVSSSKSLGYETSVVTREPLVSTDPVPYPNEHDYLELNNKDFKAKEQAEANLAAYLRPRRDITKLRQR